MPEVDCVNLINVPELGVVRQNHCDSDKDDNTDERSSLAELNKRGDSVHLYVMEKVIP